MASSTAAPAAATAAEMPTEQAPPPATSSSPFTETEPLLSSKELKFCTKGGRRFFVLMFYGILFAQFLTASVVTLAFSRSLAEQMKQLNVVVVSCLALMVAAVFFALNLSGHLRTFLINIFMLVTVPCGLGCVLGFMDAVLGWQAGFLGVSVLSVTFLVLAIVCFFTYWDLVKKSRGFWLLAISFAVATLSFVAVGVTLRLLKMSIDLLRVAVSVLVVFAFLAHVTYDVRLMTEGIHEVQLNANEYCYAVLLLYVDIIELVLWPLELLSGERQPEQKKKEKAAEEP